MSVNARKSVKTACVFNADTACERAFVKSKIRATFGIFGIEHALVKRICQALEPDLHFHFSHGNFFQACHPLLFIITLLPLYLIIPVSALKSESKLFARSKTLF